MQYNNAHACWGWRVTSSVLWFHLSSSIQESIWRTNKCSYHRDNFKSPLIPSVLLLAVMTTGKSQLVKRAAFWRCYRRRIQDFVTDWKWAMEGEGQEEEVEADFSFLSWWDHPFTQIGNTCWGPGLWGNRIKYWNFLWITWIKRLNIRYWISRFGAQQESVILDQDLGASSLLETVSWWRPQGILQPEKGWIQNL